MYYKIGTVRNGRLSRYELSFEQNKKITAQVCQARFPARQAFQCFYKKKREKALCTRFQYHRKKCSTLIKLFKYFIHD